MMHRQLTAIAALTGLLAFSWAAGAEEVRILNPSFESFTGDSSDSWAAGAMNVHNVEGELSLSPSDGDRMLTLQGATTYDIWPVQSYVLQTLEEEIDESATYTLTFDLTRGGSGLQVCSGGAELYWDNEGTPTRIVRASYVPANVRNYTTFQLQASGAELAGLSGKKLGILLFSSPSVYSNTYVAFDNVQLEKTVASVPQGNSVSVAVPDFSFEESGQVNRQWADMPLVWGGGGWPIGGSSYGQVPTEGDRQATNSAYQLIPAEVDTFIEGATYTLTVDVSLRGDIEAGKVVTDSSVIVFYREDQDFGDATSTFRGPTVGILDGKTMSIGNAPGAEGVDDWTTMTLSYVATAADDGKRIGIGVMGAVAGRESVFDNVRLTYQLGSAFPDPVVCAPGFKVLEATENPGDTENLEQPGEEAFNLTVRSRTTYDVPRDKTRSLLSVSCIEGSTVNVRGTMHSQAWEFSNGSTWNLAPGGSHLHERGAARIGHNGGRIVYWNIMGGRYLDTSTHFAIGKGGGVAMINQAGGLVKLNPDLEFCNTAEDACMWYLSGGQLVVAGSGHRPQNYVEMIHHGAHGGIEVLSQGELFVRGNRTEDLRLIDSDGDALLNGARFAEYGDWTLNDGTKISGYTRFRATEPPAGDSDNP